MRTWLVGCAAFLLAVPASADTATTCVRESEEGQLARDGGQFTEARALLASCARPECPTIVRRDCADFLAELERRMPTIVLAAKSERGQDLEDVRVTMDGLPLVDRLGAMAVSVD